MWNKLTESQKLSFDSFICKLSEKMSQQLPSESSRYEKFRRSLKKYNSSEKGKATLKRYRTSEKGKETVNTVNKKYAHTEKGKEAIARKDKKYREGKKLCNTAS